MSKLSKEQLERYKRLIGEFGDAALELDYGEVELLEATKKYFEATNNKNIGLDIFEGFGESLDKVKKAYMFSRGLKDESLQEILLKYPMMEKFLTDFFDKHEGNIGSNIKAVSMLYIWASHNPSLSNDPISINNNVMNHPNAGSTKDWLSLTNSIYHLASGSIRDYDLEREKIFTLYPEDGTNARLFRNNKMAIKLVGKVIEEAEHCSNYMDKSKYLFDEFYNALDCMNILDMDTELDNSPNKGDFYLWFDLVNSANELCETGDTTNFEINKQNVLKTYKK